MVGDLIYINRHNAFDLGQRAQIKSKGFSHIDYMSAKALHWSERCFLVSWKTVPVDRKGSISNTDSIWHVFFRKKAQRHSVSEDLKEMLSQIGKKLTVHLADSCRLFKSQCSGNKISWSISTQKWYQLYNPSACSFWEINSKSFCQFEFNTSQK